MTPEDRARLEAIEVELAAHDRSGSICLHMQACCSIGTGEHTEWLIAAMRRVDTDARLAASESTYLLHRAKQAEIERNAARESGAEYIKRTDPLLACDSEDFTCGECRACAIQQRNAERAQLDGLLARIHRDGGHYQAQHGTEKAVADADALVIQAREQLDAIHQATGESAESDDSTLAERVALMLRERGQRIAELGEQLDAAVCVLDELDVRMNPKGGRIDSYAECTYSDKAVAAFAKIAHLVKS